MAVKSLKFKVSVALILYFMIIMIGTLGFILISGYSFINALYMTIITISTVGFKEVQPLDTESKIFTIFLILTSISIYGYVISVLTEYISNNRLLEELKFRKVQKKINKLKNHAIICGYGRNGRQAVVTLQMYKKPCVIIDKDSELINSADFENNLLYVWGDATNDEILLKAGIMNASSLITAMPSDANNLYVVLSARQLNPDCRIISRASNESSYKKLKIAGADNVIMPDKLGGEHMASLVVTPDIIEFIDRLSIEGENANNIVELVIEELPPQFQNKSILDLDLRKKTGCTVIGFKTPDKDYVINPDSFTKMVPNSKLIVIGKPEQIKKLHELF
jgi:voltage-gated potassium channel